MQIFGALKTAPYRCFKNTFSVQESGDVNATLIYFCYTLTDEMINGAFKSIKHTHTFSENNGITEMKDEFKFEASYKKTIIQNATAQ